MTNKQELKIKLDKRSLYLRSLVAECLFGGGRGHMGSAMSLIEILRVLYDDILRYNCKTDTGKTGIGGIASSMEGAKLGASVLFFDLGITDAITDKHRTYAPSFTIPVN